MKAGGCGPFAIGLLSLAFSGYVYYDSLQRNKKAEQKNEAYMSMQERKAKVMHLRQFNQALAAHVTGAALMQRNLTLAERERVYKIKHGEPVKA